MTAAPSSRRLQVHFEAGGAAGAVRSFTGDYLVTFMTSGLACLLDLLLVLRVTRPTLVTVAAVWPDTKSRATGGQFRDRRDDTQTSCASISMIARRWS
jgi:hypothetical protein